jgi:hypothetical protein
MFYCMRRCIVSVSGTDGARHTVETDAMSLFDAAYKAREQWALLSWFDPRAFIEVRADNDRWHVRPDRLRVWANGSSRKRRREFQP